MSAIIISFHQTRITLRNVTSTEPWSQTRKHKKLLPQKVLLPSWQVYQ